MSLIPKWRKDLYELKDLEKMYRFIILEKIHPYSLSILHNNINLILNIYKEIENNHELLLKYLNCNEI